MGRIVLSMEFECAFSMLIMLNCVSMGVQAHAMVTSDISPVLRASLDWSEHFFTSVFLLEFLMRLKVFGWQVFIPKSTEGRSNFLDAFLVIVTGIILTWLLPLVAMFAGFGTDSGFFNSLLVLRAFRLARLVRVFRKVPLFREAWMLIRGLSDSARTLFWTVVVIFFVTYVFAIFGLVLVVSEVQIYQAGVSDPEELARLDELMSTIGGMDRLMYTLIQVLTMDSFHSFMREILRIVWWSWIYFYAYMGVACFVLMNLVTAIIVENAMASSQSDHEHALQEKASKQSKDMAELKHLFLLMDSDGSGTLNWDEFRESFDDPMMNKKWMLLDFQAEEGKELFALLDDGDGEIETEEFFDGLMRMKGVAQAKDVYRLQKSVFKLHADLKLFRHDKDITRAPTS